MKVVLDTDILSTFARIKRLDILNTLFQEVIVPSSVVSELDRTQIKISSLKHGIAKLTRQELGALGNTDTSLGRGERECIVIAKHRNIPLASNDRVVHLLCRNEGLDYFDLPRLLRFAISEKVIKRDEAKALVKLIEHEERTVIKNKDEIFK